MRPLNRRVFRSASISLVLASSLVLAACSDDDDDPAVVAAPDDTTVTLSVPLTVEQTVPLATAPGASGQAEFTVDTTSGAVSGAATVMGTTGTPTVAHIHTGAPGEAGEAIITLVANDDSTVWSAPADATLDTPQLALFNAGDLYINVHTAANESGELRGQLSATAIAPPAAADGSYTFTFRNTSAAQPMTPPVVALHTPADGAGGGLQVFAVGQPATGEVRQIAEDGNNTPLVDVLASQATVSASGAAVPEPAGPLQPGTSSSITLTPSGPDQVMSIVAMVVCTNDGFSGIDSQPLPTAETTMTVPVYDAGSETNVLQLSYWVPPCGGGDTNLGDDENGAIALHPGQSGSENADFDFAAGSELLEVTVTPN